MPLKKILVITISLIVLIVGGYFGYRYFVSSDKSGGVETTRESEVVSGEFVDAVRSTGIAKLAYEQKLRFAGGSKVAGVFVKSGQSVKKGELLAQLDMSEFRETITQAQERISLASSKLATAREKIGGLELQKLQAELRSLESKRAIVGQDLQKLIKTAPLKTETKSLEREQKKSEIASKEAAYTIDIALWEKDRDNKVLLLDRKKLEAKKIVTITLQNINTDLSELRTVYSGINKIFGFDQSIITNEERSDAVYLAYNVPGLRSAVESAWRDSKTSIGDVQEFSISIDGKIYSQENAIIINDLFLKADAKVLESLERAIKALDNSDVYDGSLTRAEIDSKKSIVNGYRTTILSRIQVGKDNKNLLPLTTSDALIASQVDRELADKKLALTAQKIILEKLKIELLESEPTRTGSGMIDISVRRDIDAKRQELLDLEVSIASRESDIRKQSSGSSDEIVGLMSDLKQAQSELNKILSKREQYEMRAPIDGMIRSVKLLPGDTISPTGMTGNEGTIIIEDSEAVMIVAKLGQKDIVRIRQNGEAKITLDAFPDRSFTGTIAEISNSPDENTNGGETLYEIRILFARGDTAIYSGMSANLEIFLSQKDNIIFVPLTAITTDPTTGESKVTVVKSPKEKEERSITLGQVDGDRVEVLSGLIPGEKVLSIDFSLINYQEAPQGSMIP